MGWPPKLFKDQSAAERFLALTVGPVLFGAICGWLLGVTEIGYTALTLLTVVGGLAAGYEHDSPRAGALRGLWGGSLFAVTIFEVHRLIGAEPTAQVPDPAELMIIVFAVFGSALGAYGASRRRRREAPAS